MKINIIDWVNDTVAGNQFRGLDGKAYEFPWDEAVVLARSAHDPIFKLNENYGWGTRWYALYQLDSRYVFTVGYGYWSCSREVPPDWVPEILFRYFTRNEVTPAGKAWLK
jgi:hypothetical protein